MKNKQNNIKIERQLSRGFIFSIISTIFGFMLLIPTLILQCLGLLPVLVIIMLPISQIIISVFGISSIIEMTSLKKLFSETVEQTVDKIINKSMQIDYIRNSNSPEFCRELIKLSYFPPELQKHYKSFEDFLTFFTSCVFMYDLEQTIEIYINEDKILKKTTREFDIIKYTASPYSYKFAINSSFDMNCTLDSFSVDSELIKEQGFVRINHFEDTSDNCNFTYFKEQEFNDCNKHHIAFNCTTETSIKDNMLSFRSTHMCYNSIHKLIIHKNNRKISIDTCLYAIGKTENLGKSNLYNIKKIIDDDSSDIIIYEVTCRDWIFPGDGYYLQIKWN